MRVTIINRQDFVPIDEKEVRRALELLPPSPPLPGKYRLSLVYLDDAEMAELNRRYLKKDGPTDVLAFPLERDVGEVVVSGETALHEAEAREIEPAGELLLYTVHGVLHLMGYDDKTPEEADVMHEMEKRVVTGMGYSWDWD